MAVMMPREKWTDERLDDLNKKVDDGFARLDGEIKRLDGDITELRREMNARFENLESRLDARFNAVNRNMFAGLFVVVAAIIGSNAF
jgi:chromosome segregation ATPase